MYLFVFVLFGVAVAKVLKKLFTLGCDATFTEQRKADSQLPAIALRCFVNKKQKLNKINLKNRNKN